MWNESGSATDDFGRIAALTRSQYVQVSPYQPIAESHDPRIKVALERESVKPWHEVERDFLECEYRAVRDRQMQELEAEDDLLSKVPVRYVLGGCLPQRHLSFCTRFSGISRRN